MFVARAQLRRRWRAILLLAVLLGVVVGLSSALVAGARRSSSVVSRYFEAARKYDAVISDGAWTLNREDVLAFDGVLRADASSYIGLMATGPGGEPAGGINGVAVTWSAKDPTMRVKRGRVPTDSELDAVMVNQEFVLQFGLSVGDTVEARTFGLDQADEVASGVYEPNGPRYRFRIAGVLQTIQDIALDEVHALGGSAHGNANAMLISNDFYEAHKGEFLNFGATYQLVLRDGGQQGGAALQEAVDADAGAVGDPPQVLPPSSSATFQDVGRRAALDAPVDLETTALLALAIGIALAGAIVTGLILRAEQRAHDDDAPTLRALGSTRSQLGAAAALRVLPVAVGGVVIGLALALALSARFPVGIGRQLELDPGVEADALVLAAGTLLVIVFVVGLAFAFGASRISSEDDVARRLTVAERLARIGAPTGAVLGAYLAFARGRRARPTPSRQAIAGGAALLSIVVTLAIYLAGVDQLYSVPAAHGWRWDAALGNVNFRLAEYTTERLTADADVRSMTPIAYGQAALNGDPTEILAFDPDGDRPPDVIAGRLPRSAREIALGAGMLDQLDVAIGSTVRLSLEDGEFGLTRAPRTRRLKVVGQTLSPVFGESDPTGIGVVTLAAIEAAGGDATPRIVLIEVAGHDPSAALGRLDQHYTEEIQTDFVPGQIVNRHRVRSLPLVGLALAAAMGMLLVLYVLALTIRLRRHDLAVIRAIGLPARRLRRLLAWEGSIVSVAAIAIGGPLGLLIGAALWHRVARPIGVHDDVVVPALLLAVVPLAGAVVIAAAVYFGRGARRTEVAALLSAE